MADGLVGNAWTLTITCTQGGTLTDPGAVPTVTVTDPTGVVTTPTPSHVSTGTYSTVVYCPTAGTWEAVPSVPYPTTGFGAAKIEWTVAPA